ncbi:DUF998 domain-containing protein [Laceyella sacchari]|uniref:DUF998 domain-containing protein n=1 Tax=Laceyella sacchari TaxID=37482 RepID=A0ABY5TYN8_LACSH|nr:DUF998 domain-containing protein [Laceyella sacchari]TCW34459.1 uncharacterized protein DUF998 [Laceyella sacchari]UWE02527.1 DUF998 domain-containing protein [Laceyella sacchari]
MNIITLLSYVSGLAVVGYFIIMLYLHVKFKNYNPIYHAVSDYGVGESRKLQVLSGVCHIISSLLLVFVLLCWDKDFHFKTAAIIMLGIRALTILGVLVFPTDLEGEKRTTTGRLHYLSAIIQFTMTATIIFNLTPVFVQMGISSAYATTLVILTWITKISLIGVILGMFVSPIKKIFGLVERGFLFSSALYFLIFSIMLPTLISLH